MKRARSVGWVVLASGLLATPAFAQVTPTGSPQVPIIIVEGQASRDIVPDMAVITLGITTDRPSAADAARENAKAARVLVGEIAASGIAERDIETTQATLSPVYDSPRNGEAPRVAGFRASNAVQIKVRKLDTAGELAGRLLDKGANTLQGVDFTVSDPEPVLDALRAEATKDARRRAEIYAGAAGAKLGRLLEIRPADAAQPQRAFKLRSAMDSAPVSMPLEAGTETLEARVSVTWALDGSRP